jgi:copper transport protein
MAAGHTDGELFDWLSNGVPGTAMPAYRDSLSETDRWNLINYIRKFADADAVAGAIDR